MTYDPGTQWARDSNVPNGGPSGQLNFQLPVADMNPSSIYPDLEMQRKKQVYPNEYYVPKVSYFKSEQKNRFRKYCTRLCKESLITGFPVIVSTRNPCRRALKALVFCVCICGFLYQTTEFLNMYLEYPTMVNIQIENPDFANIPAIGFCNKNRMRRRELCSRSPEDCVWTENRTSFCIMYPRYCIRVSSSEVLAAPDIRKILTTDRSFAYNDVVGQRYEDLIDGCAIQTEKVRKCENWVSVPAVDREGFPNKCFTLESLWGQPEVQSGSIPVTGRISVKLTLHPEDAMNYYELIQAHILAHDPHAILNPIKDGISLEAGKEYNIYVSQMVTERLPAPYVTNCTDYLKLWKKNGGRGPLTGKSCAEKCKMEGMLESKGCVPQSIAYPSNSTVCEDKALFPTEEIVEGCSRECSEACHDISYALSVEVKSDRTALCKMDVHCKQKDMYLNFLFNRFEVTKFVHEPKYESVGVFSYIGGYIGMWLGISLVALFDFLETLFHLLRYPYTEWRSKKGRKTHVAHDM